MTQSIVLHVGLPKAASTTIQDWALSNRETLREAGIDYPLPAVAARHQNLVRGLIDGKQDWLRETLHNSPCPTLFLSAEGLSWHLQDSPESHLKEIRSILAPFDTVMVFNDRDPQKWARSFYRQLIVNPVNKKFNYGTSQHYEDFIATERVQFMLDRDALVARAQQAYGVDRTVRTALEQDWAQDLCTLLNIPEMASDLRSHPRQNEGFDVDVTEFCRQVNAMALATPHRIAVFGLFQGYARSTIDVIRNTLNNQRSKNAFSQADLKPVIEQLSPNSPKQSEIRKTLLEILQVHQSA